MFDSDELSTFDNQYYPTPRSLAQRMFRKFKNRNIKRLLEPEAGRGDLVDAVMDHYRHCDRPTVECVEIDLSNQAILRAKGYRVVGTDFLKCKGGCVYSHIIMNPPFRDGVKHLLHAWELLLAGEIVCVLPAYALKNATTMERKLLARLIAEHGSVKFLTEAFMTADTKRTTRVEIAIVHLARTTTEYTSFIEGLRKEIERRQEPAPESMNELVVPRNFIENLVINFDCAVEAARHASLAKARAEHFAERFDPSIVETEERAPVALPASVSWSFNEVYDDLKERAWSTVLRSTAVLEKLSSKAQKRVQASFKEICSLEFTYENIWGFLDGIIAQQGQIQLDMICDVFDMVSYYHTQNCVCYQGWKSNDKHRLNAFRIKTTRFILPARDQYRNYSMELSHEDRQRFRDFDKVFALLDGKNPTASIAGLCHLFSEHFRELMRGARLSSDYFDVRFYSQAGTFHVFPRRKDLIDKINRVVGEHRQWLPHDKDAAPAAFWSQYEAAEKITARVPIDMLAWLDSGRDSDDEVASARARLLSAWKTAAAELGIRYDASMLIAHEQQQRARYPVHLNLVRPTDRPQCQEAGGHNP